MVDVIDYGALPGRERNLDPKSRSLGVIYKFIGLLPYARAGAEAVARGESFWVERRNTTPTAGIAAIL